MMMYIGAPGYLTINDYAKRKALKLNSVFLAGGITGCPDWQSNAVGMLRSFMGVTDAVFNPRRANFPIEDKSAAKEQIEWEFYHLKVASMVLFWFPAGQIQPIALYELGFHANSEKPIVVGADKEYPRRTDVIEQLSHIRPELTVCDTLSETVKGVHDHFR